MAEALAGLCIEAVDLVPDLDNLLTRLDAELTHDRLDVLRLRFAVLVRDVAYMQDHIGGNDLLERGAKGSHQGGWQIGDEADGVGQNDFRAMRGVERAHGG